MGEPRNPSPRAVLPLSSGREGLGEAAWEGSPGSVAGGMLTSLLAVPPPPGAGAWVKRGPEGAPSRGPDPPPAASPSRFHHITTAQPKPEPPLSREVTCDTGPPAFYFPTRIRGTEVLSESPLCLSPNSVPFWQLEWQRIHHFTRD